MEVQKIYDKGSGKTNEDDILIKDNIFAVFDGATSLVKFEKERGETGGKLAAKIAKEVFSKNNSNLKDLVKEANFKILDYMKKEGVNIKQREALWSTGLIAVRLKGDEGEFVSIGDCLGLIVFKDGTSRFLADYKDHDLETMIKWKKLEGKKLKEKWEILKEQIDNVRKGANINYGSLNGEENAMKFVNSGCFSVKNIKSIILFTDGLFIPKENPEEEEDWELFIEIYEKSGLEGLLKYVRSLENGDPECSKYPRFKLNDDIAAIGIDF